MTLIVVETIDGFLRWLARMLDEEIGNELGCKYLDD